MGKIKRLIRLNWLKLRRRQRQPVTIPTIDNSQHECKHCGYRYEGRFCPMCSMPGEWQRFTWQRLLNGFLDIWGMGNRPMFRSIGHLLWRPGYMIRDYLGGHYLSYFPPFKMLAVMIVFVTCVIWLLGIDTTAASLAQGIADSDAEFANYFIISHFLKIRDFLLNNALYRTLLQIILLVAAVWIVFRKKGFNIVETFFAIVYISCQMQLLSIVWLVLTREYIYNSIFPYILPEFIVLLALIIDFRQLFSLRLWSAVWRTLLVGLMLALLYFVVFIALIILFLAGAMIERLFA